MTAKAYWINAAERQITEVTFDDTGIDDIRKYVGCGDAPFTVGYSFNGDPLYLDDEGLFKPQQHFFQILDRPNLQPLPGNALVTGGDRPERGSHDPRITLDELKGRIRFLSRPQADAWSVKVAREAASRINGVMISNWESVWRDMPQPELQPSVWLHLTKQDGTKKYPVSSVWAAVDIVRHYRMAHWEPHGQPGVRPELLTDNAGTILLTQDELLEACR